MAESKRGGNPRSIPGGKKQVNFNIDEALHYKVKYIVLQENKGMTNSDIYTMGIEKYVEEYEKKNGKIKLPASLK